MGRSSRRKKRLSMGGRPSPGLNLVQNNDDQAEKEQARLNRERGNPPATPIDQTPSRSSSSRSFHTPGSARRSKQNTPQRSPHQLYSKQDVREMRRQILSSAQLSELYSQCIKLNTQNKITKENTWGLQLIDYISEVLDETTSDDVDNAFQKASHTLDASAKIYSCRVDSVHNETYKVLNVMSVSDPKDTGGDKGGNKPSSSRRRGPSNTLIPEDKRFTINGEKQEGIYEVDPMFRKMAFSFDEGGVKGILMNQLDMNSNGRLLFDSEFHVNQDDSKSEPSAEEFEQIVDRSDKLQKILRRIHKRQNRDHGLIGVPLSSTHNLFNEQMAAMKDGKSLYDADFDEYMEESNPQRALLAEFDSDDEMGGYSQMADDLPPLGDIGMPPTQDYQQQNKKSNEERENAKKKANVFGVRSPVLEYDANYMEQLKQLRVNNWAGNNGRSSHWLFNRRRKPDAEKQKPKERVKRSAQMKFVTPTKVDDTLFLEPMQRQRKQKREKKNPNKMSDEMLAKYSQETHLLPDDHQIDATFFMCHFYKCGDTNVPVEIYNDNAIDENDDDDDGGEPLYNFNNEYDRENYIAPLDASGELQMDEEPIGDVHPFAPSSPRPELPPEGEFDIDQFEVSASQDDPTMSQMVRSIPQQSPLHPDEDEFKKLKVNFVDKPSDVHTIPVKFATIPKRIDVTNLKTKLWSSLQTDNADVERKNVERKRIESSIETPRKQMDADAPLRLPLMTPGAGLNSSDVSKMELGEHGAVKVDFDESKELIELHSFQESVKLLSNKLGHRTLKVLSVPYCFMCVLHLANENNLQFTSSTDDPMNEDELTDFKISQYV